MVIITPVFLNFNTNFQKIEKICGRNQYLKIEYNYEELSA